MFWVFEKMERFSWERSAAYEYNTAYRRGGWRMVRVDVAIRSVSENRKSPLQCCCPRPRTRWS